MHEPFTPGPGEVVKTTSTSTTLQVTINHMGTLDLEVVKRVLQTRFKVTDIHEVDKTHRVLKTS